MVSYSLFYFIIPHLPSTFTQHQLCSCSHYVIPSWTVYYTEGAALCCAFLVILTTQGNNQSLLSYWYHKPSKWQIPPYISSYFISWIHSLRDEPMGSLFNRGGCKGSDYIGMYAYVCLQTDGDTSLMCLHQRNLVIYFHLVSIPITWFGLVYIEWY